MEIELIATGLGHRKASYEMFNARHDVSIKESEWLILAKLSEINDRLKIIEDLIVLKK